MRSKLSCFSEALIEAGWLTAVAILPMLFNTYAAKDFALQKVGMLRSIALVMVLAWGILARSVPVLVDKQVIPATDLKNAAEAIDGVSSAYAIRSRGSRYHCFAELTVSVKKDVTVEVAHLTADAVEAELRHRFGLSEITVHVEPC